MRPVTLTAAAAQQIEVALKYARNVCVGSNWSTDDTDEALAAIRAARAQEQEPVAWRVLSEDGEKLSDWIDGKPSEGQDQWESTRGNTVQRAYAAPVQQVKLTDDEIQMLWVNWDANRTLEWYECIEDLVRIVEDYIKENQMVAIFSAPQAVQQEPVAVVMWPNDPDQIPEGQHYIRDDGSPMYLDGCEAQYSVCLRKTDYCLGYDTIAYCFDKRSAEMLARALNHASEEQGK